MVNGITTIELREALLYYVLKELRLRPFNFSGFQPPKSFLLIMLNRGSYMEQISRPSTCAKTFSKYPLVYDTL